ncbi:terminase [Clavibacter sp. VKM Ac-2872]|uniref:terminase n=1 Tax=Clavibacter sp. VKM Ac-2872 TaxID=2783812 RepID=UPI00188D44D4|nr:terminase [Clavibacter sp. VKM Ac-2872]MBF4625537.1 terminase [Clavibacter sp. VKM Ac-2872]
MIEFARVWLGVELRPWQKWLLIAALELLVDGTYRYRKIIVIVGRQNGKTKLIEVLAAWWLFVDADAFPEHLPASEFLVLGAAQDVGTAKKVWNRVLGKCNPEVLSWPSRFTDAERQALVPALAALSSKPRTTNGTEAIRLKNGARYEIAALASGGARGDSVARAILDELREQKNWEGWAAFSKTLNGTFNSQLWAISSAGDARSVVLKDLRDGAIRALEEWEAYVDAGVQSIEEFANGHDVSIGLFEWSALPGCDVDDPEGICQANPSIGYGYNVETILSDLASGEPEHIFRNEVLCQWNLASVETHIDPTEWHDAGDPEARAAEGSRLVVGVDTSTDRRMSYVSVAGWTDDGQIIGELVAERPGMLWVPDYVAALCAKQGTKEVALQTRGAPSSEFVARLEELDLTIIRIEGSALGATAGQMKDHVRDGRLVHRQEEPLRLAVSGAIVRKLGEVWVWDRGASPVDISPLVAMSEAVYGLTSVAAPAPRPPATPPPPAELITRDYVSPGEVNLALADF